MSQAEIVEALLDFIGRPGASEAEFEALALRVFAYQFTHNAPYRRFAQQRGRTPLTVRRWRDIPAVPIKAFKDLTLSCCPPDDAERVFMTSGTTGAGATISVRFARRFGGDAAPARCGRTLSSVDCTSRFFGGGGGGRRSNSAIASRVEAGRRTFSPVISA